MNSLRTKQALAESLKKLTARKDFQEISVGGIAAGCGLSRNTFYYHFRDKYDLANWIFHSETAVLFTVVEWLFLLAGALTTVYMLKLFICLFVLS